MMDGLLSTEIRTFYVFWSGPVGFYGDVKHQRTECEAFDDEMCEPHVDTLSLVRRILAFGDATSQWPWKTYKATNSRGKAVVFCVRFGVTANTELSDWQHELRIAPPKHLLCVHGHDAQYSRMRESSQLDPLPELIKTKAPP